MPIEEDSLIISVEADPCLELFLTCDPLYCYYA